MPLPIQLCPPRRGYRGQSLLQLMVTLLVLAVCVGVALPGLSGLMDRQRAAGARHLLSSHFASARMTAIQRNTTVALCPSSDGRHCTPGVDWSDGWMSFLAQNDSAQAPAQRDILRFQPWSARRGWRIQTTEGRGRLRYLGNGRAYGSNQTLRICRDNHLHGKVIVNNSGRIRSERLDEPGKCAD